MKIFKNDDAVKFVKTSDPRLDNQTGIVLGKYGMEDFGFHIVMFDKQPEGYDKAIVITDACLEFVGE